MDPVRGESLYELSKRSGPLPPERAGYLTWQVLGALGHAHNAGIIHGNIKPSNLIVADNSSIKVIDYGVAKKIAEAGQSTSDRGPLGTPVYAAPEQLLSQHVDGRADLYSCGVVFYSLLTGALPFKAGNRDELIRAILHDPPTPASTYLPDLPDWCGTIIEKALAKAPVDRFQTAEEFRGALTSAIGGAAGLPARELDTPAVFEGAKTVVLRVPVRMTPVAPAPKAVVPPPLPPAAAPPSPAAPSPQRAAVARPAAKPVKRSQLLAAGAALAVVVAAAVAYSLRADPVAPATEVPGRATASPPVAPPAPAAAPVSPAPVAAPESPAPAATTPEIPANAPAVPTPSPAAADTRPEPGLAPAVPAPAPAPAPTPAAKTAPIVPAPPAISKAAFPSMVFDAEAVIAVGDENRERDGRMVLADGKVTVTDRNGSLIATFPFDRIESVSYSTARHPLWNSPSGPAELLRVDGGAFGIRRADRNWVAFRTSDAVQVIRVRDEDIRNVVAALEARTGRPVVRVAEKKD